MKTLQILFTIIVLFSFSKFTVTQTVTESDSSALNKIHAAHQADTLIFSIYGMDCPGCEGGLEKQVDKIPAVKFSKANWLEQKLTIVLEQDSTLKLESLKKRIEKANFTMGDEIKDQ